MSSLYEKALANAKKMQNQYSEAGKADLQAKANKQKAKKEAEKKAKKDKLKKAKDKTVTTPNGHTVNAGGRKQLTPEAKLELERQQATNAVPKFLRNMTEAVIDNSVLGGVTTLAYGKKPSSDFDSPYYDEIHSGTSATLGRLTGQGAMFASQFAAGSAPLNKISQAVAKTKLGQAVAKSVIGDATIGLGQNIVMAKGEGLEGEDLVKDVALNTGLDLALGAGLEVIPAAKNYLKNTKLAKQAKNVGEVVDTTKKVAETGNLGVKNTLPDAQKVNSGAISDAKQPAKIESNTRLSGNDLDEYMSVGSKTARRVKAKNIETGTSPILTSPDEIKKYIDDSISGIESNSTKGYGRVGKSLADDVKTKTNGEVDLYGKYLELNSDDLRHSSKRHSLPKRDGDIPLSVVDFENIPDYIDNYDDILDIVQTKDGLRIQLGKKINGYSVITEIVQDSRNSLKFKNMWGVSTEKYLREYKNKRIRYRATSNNAIGREASYTFSELPLNKTLPQSSYEVKPEKANKTLKDLGADVKNPNLEMTYEEASKVYDTYKHGTPKKLPGKGDVSKAADTIIGSDFISDEMRKSLEDNISNYVKTTKRNKVTVDNVKAKIDKNGLNESIKSFGEILSEGRMVKEEDIAMGAELIKRLDDLGDYERALDVTDDLIEMMSQAGRTLQAANIFSKMTPYGKVRTVKRTAERMAEKYGRDVVPDDGLLKQLFEESDPTKSDEIKRKIFVDLWEQVPPTLMEKLDAIRYTAMLSSPKTHIRNILGNTAMYVGKGLSDGVGQALEKALKGKMDRLGGIRTKSVLNPLSAEDKALKSRAREVFDEIKDTVLNNDVKYIEKGNSRPIESRIFKSKVLEGSRKVVSGTLEYEDEAFMKLNFESAFAKICKANGIKASDLTAEQIKKFSDYAIQQAQTATFRDPNALATAMNKVYRWANNTQGLNKGSKAARTGVKLAMDATVPFKKTPANVLKQGWRYSPGGVAQGIIQCVTAKDAETLLKGIEVLSNGIVGTPVLLAGVYLAKQGLVNGSIGDYTDKDTKYKKMLGQQDYSVTVGDKTITMDWMSPYSMPFFVGVELGTALSGDDRVSGTELVDSLASITDPFLEMSMLQGLQTLITADYKTNSAQTLIQNTVQSYVLQFVPAIFQQIAKTVAKTATTTSVPSDGTSFGKFLNRTGTQFKSKIPGLYETNEPDIDLWGRTQTKENVWDYVNAGLRNMLSPANIKDMNITYVDEEILRLYDNLDYEPKSVIPTPAKSNVDFNKQNYKMTASEFTKYKKDFGTYRYNELKKLFATEKYKKSSNEEKAKMIQAVYSDANEQAKKKFLISSGKVTEEEYSLAKLKSNNSSSALKIINSGKTTATKVVNAKQKVKDTDIPDKDILKAYVLAGDYDENTIQAASGASENTIREAVNLKNSGVGLTEFQKIYANSDYDGNGRIKKAEAVDYLNKTKYSASQKRAIFDALMQNPNTKNPY